MCILYVSVFVVHTGKIKLIYFWHRVTNKAECLKAIMLFLLFCFSFSSFCWLDSVESEKNNNGSANLWYYRQHILHTNTSVCIFIYTHSKQLGHWLSSPNKIAIIYWHHKHIDNKNVRLVLSKSVKVTSTERTNKKKWFFLKKWDKERTITNREE